MSLLTPQWRVASNVFAFTLTRSDCREQLPVDVRRFPAPLIRQEHGTRVLRAEAVVDGQAADAVLTAREGILCQIQTADCLPVLLAHRHGQEVAAAHAGWRGLAAGVLEATVQAMDSSPSELMAWIGPCISARQYEVGAELLAAFLGQAPRALHPGIRAAFTPLGKKYCVDLPAIASLRLRALGVDTITVDGGCTYSDPARFHSWRRDGKTAGRMVTGICRLPPQPRTAA